MSAYKEYHIVWEIDLAARSPREAAEVALKIQRDPKSLASFFTVWEEGEELPSEIYLGEENYMT